LDPLNDAPHDGEYVFSYVVLFRQVTVFEPDVDAELGDTGTCTARNFVVAVIEFDPRDQAPVPLMVMPVATFVHADPFHFWRVTVPVVTLPPAAVFTDPLMVNVADPSCDTFLAVAGIDVIVVTVATDPAPDVGTMRASGSVGLGRHDWPSHHFGPVYLTTTPA
jgi:hypothetical protein